MVAATAVTEVEAAARAERAAVLAIVARDVRDLELAEDAVQDALLAALRQWPQSGVPQRSGAWLTTVARRAALRAIERGRSVSVDAAAIERLAAQAAPDPAEAPWMPDARLELLFACCHPAIALEAQVALTLRTAGGLTTPEIARAFLLDEATLAQRLVRAQRKIRDSGVPFAVPPAERLAERLDGVLGVIYLIFNEGYAATSGQGRVRDELCDEALRLARLVAVLLPAEPEALGLAALVLAHDARRDARVDSGGRAVPLDEQDRSRYDAAKLVEAERLLERALRARRPGPYVLQAAIACLHSGAPAATDTDWAQIAALYGALHELAPSPMVALSRAAAIAMADGVPAGLALVEPLVDDPVLCEHHLLHATRAELLRRSGHTDDARAAYVRAIELAPETGSARRDLRARLDELGAAAASRRARPLSG